MTDARAGASRSGRTPTLVLASRSPRRADLLAMLGLAFEIDPASVPEDLLPGESPWDHVSRLAADKAGAVAARHPDALVLGGDTVVIRDGDVLGKPDGEVDAVEMLVSLAGRTHEVASALALAEPGGEVQSGVSTTLVRFRGFGRSEAEAYVATGEPMDKAGAYGIQGLGAVLVEGVEGDFFTVMGLPLPLLVRLLARAGAPYSFEGRAGATHGAGQQAVAYVPRSGIFTPPEAGTAGADGGAT